MGIQLKAVAYLMLATSAAIAQTTPKPTAPPPFTADGYTDGEFYTEVACSNIAASAVLARDAKGTITLKTTNAGRTNTLTLFTAQPNLMDTCFASLSCRNVSKRLSVIAREDAACGRMANDPIYHTIDVNTFKYTKISSKTAFSLGLDLEFINFKNPEIEKIFKTEVTDQLYATINIYLTSNEGATGPGDMLAASLPKQPNTFFSGKDHILVFIQDQKPKFVKGRFVGKGFNGAWSGQLDGAVYKISTKKTADGEDAVSGNGEYKLGNSYKITWAHGEFP